MLFACFFTGDFMKKSIRASLAVIGALLVLDAVFLGMVGNFNFGLIVTFMLGAGLLAYGAFTDRINMLIPCWVRRVVLLCLCCGIALITFLAVYGNVDTADYKEDAVVVLGAGLKGETPSLPLVRRLDKAVEYYENNNAAVIVVSGGKGFQEDITEALAMERYLVRKGVPMESIIKEEQATSTFENFKYSKELLDKHFGDSYKTTFITNDFHIYRASRLAKLAGIEEVSHISGITEWYTLPVNYLRECFAVAKLWILKK